VAAAKRELETRLGPEKLAFLKRRAAMRTAATAEKASGETGAEVGF
jgi:hypothetical protein